MDLDRLIGACRYEINLFAALMRKLEASSFDERARQVLAQSETDWNGLAHAYLEARQELDPEAADEATMGDIWFRIPVASSAQHWANS